MPVLFRYLEPVMETYNMLSSCRQLGAFGGVGPISLSDIITYLEWDSEQFSGIDEMKRWVIYLRSMDNAYMMHQASTAKGK